METLQFLRWTLRYDAEKTRQCYSEVPRGEALECGCEECLNFTAAREQAFPRRARDLFDRLGIDVAKEVEVMHLSRLANGRHLYSGWYHLVGEIVAGNECWKETSADVRRVDLEPVTESCSLGFSSGRSLLPAAFTSHPTVQLEFSAEVPWVSSAPEPER